ncbi:MAG TPA: VWA domain-containing protein [Vicinamibacterales bacterium]|nr:VWA domain-containing protein [Vicinamibacterales bacterium]
MLSSIALVTSLTPTFAQDRPTFRARIDTVEVNVSVKKGNNAVVGLRAEDFVLQDNGVVQQVEALSVEAVPIDVSLFMDTSGSTQGTLSEMKDSVRRITAMLRPDDRFRLLTIGNSVINSVPWTAAGQPLPELDVVPVGGISLVYDAVVAALLHSVDPGRRHLVVAMTDGEDCGSIVNPALLREMAGRSEAVVHWILMGGRGGGPSTLATCDWGLSDTDALKTLAEGTGGEVHSGFLNPDPVKEFKKTFDAFRVSYVLRYSPAGVALPGWHKLTVAVKQANYTIRVRPGYFGG